MQLQSSVPDEALVIIERARTALEAQNLAETKSLSKDALAKYDRAYADRRPLLDLQLALGQELLKQASPADQLDNLELLCSVFHLHKVCSEFDSSRYGFDDGTDSDYEAYELRVFEHALEIALCAHDLGDFAAANRAIVSALHNDCPNYIGNHRLRERLKQMTESLRSSFGDVSENTMLAEIARSRYTTGLHTNILAILTRLQENGLVNLVFAFAWETIQADFFEECPQCQIPFDSSDMPLATKEQMVQKTMSIYATEYGVSSVEYVRACERLAARGPRTFAAGWAEAAFNALRQQFSDDDIEVVWITQLLAQNTDELGRKLELYQSLLSHQRRLLGAAESTRITLFAIGYLFQHFGNLQTAGEYMNLAWQMDLANRSFTNGQIRGINYAKFLEDIGDRKGAKRVWQEVLGSLPADEIHSPLKALYRKEMEKLGAD